MASRRDQLDAYTFARKRAVAAFLQPSPSGSEEGAPRPLRAIVPSIAAGALLLAAFGGWGLIKPGAPPGWNTPYANVLVGSDSTTRYVITGTKTPELHPVLNLASAKLLLNPSKFAVLKIDESLLDNGSIRHGATLGIPYAPDRMPDPADAGTAKLWAVCEQPGRGTDPKTAEPEKAAFVLGGRDTGSVDGTGRLAGDRTLYVETPDGTRYLVDPQGTAFPLRAPAATTAGGVSEAALLERAVFQDGAQPQMVTKDWLGTLDIGTPITFPPVPGFGSPAGLPALGTANHIGTVVTAPSGSTTQDYVVLKGRLARVSPFVAHLLLMSPQAAPLYPGSTPAPRAEGSQNFNTAAEPFTGGGPDWPTAEPVQANSGAASTSCSVYRGTMHGQTAALSVWTGSGYPEPIANGGATAYVTPGSGLLYRQVTGNAGSGALFLVTDTGLRYSVPAPVQSENGTPSDTADAQTLLGYGQVKPVPVPEVWSAFLPTGPQLSPQAAAEEQGS